MMDKKLESLIQDIYQASNKYLGLDSRLRKKHKEERARLILTSIDYESFKDSTLSERPDIINYSQDIGCEVTSAIKEYVYRSFTDYDSLRENLYSNKLDPNIDYEEFLLSEFSNWTGPIELMGAYEKKQKNLNKENYQVFSSNRLYIFAWGSDDKDIELFEEYLKNLEKSDDYLQFDMVYVFNGLYLLSYTLFPLRLEKFLFKEEEIDGLNRKAFNNIFNC